MQTLNPNALEGPRRPELLCEETLAHLVAEAVRCHPNRTAVTHADRSITYAALHAYASRVARALNARGIARGAAVGLYLRRSIDMYACMLGILYSGATYVPFDEDAPPQRVNDCLRDCGAAACISDRDVDGALAPGVLNAGVAPSAALDVEQPLTHNESDDIAYVIYTSGSSGTPKGVPVRHRNVCHFIRAANTAYQMRADDIVCQFASIAFDLSIEEIFVPLSVGAALWTVDKAALHDTDALMRAMRDGGVTVLDTVPTLLGLLDAKLPSLRLIILGGETCPTPLVERWRRPGRRIFNTYGPTEATVVATLAEIGDGQPVTIGRPLPNYDCYVVDEQMRLCERGELLIGGPGVAAGYLNNPVLTAQKFVENPFVPMGGKLYRSGDAVEVVDGTLQFLGRIDDQIKVRGHRIEPGEIEARIVAHPDVRQAVVVLHESQNLIAFYTADFEISLREGLLNALPPYMMPSRFERRDTLPTLPSGKVDRKRLAGTALTPLASAPDEPCSANEFLLLSSARDIFISPSLALDADLFLDLGGHSLLAAQFVSRLRLTPALSDVTLHDVYEARTLRKLAARLDAKAPAGVDNDLSFPPPPRSRRFLCGLAQALTLPILLTFALAPWLGVFVAFELLSGDSYNVFAEMTAFFFTYSFIHLITITFAVGVKRLVLGRTRPGRYPLWGTYYFRWWLTSRFMSLIRIKWLQGTPLIRGYLRLLGAEVGADAHISELEIDVPDLCRIGNGVVIGSRTQLANVEVVGNEMRIGWIEIGDDARVGASCVLNPNVRVGRSAQLADLTALASDTVVGDTEIWEGSPARCVGHVDLDSLAVPATAGPIRRAALIVFYTLMMFIAPPFSLAPIIPAFYLFDKMTDVIDATIGIDYRWILPLLTWPTAMVLIVLSVLFVVACRWIIMRRLQAGTSSVFSGFYARRWVLGLINDMTLDTLSSLYATVYMCSWYRLMGARIGRDAELSTTLSGRYDLMEIGEKSFIADDVIIGDEEIHRNWMRLGRVRTGSRVFVGNSAVVPAQADLSDGCLIGVKTRAPVERTQPGETWFGSPPIRLPARQRFDGAAAQDTFEPTRRQRIIRTVFEAFRISLPSMMSISFGLLTVDVLEPFIVGRLYGKLILALILASVVIGLLFAGSALTLKWLLMGRYRPSTHPMWSWWALRTEAVAVLYYGMAGELLFEHMRGTPMLPWALRFFGCRIGQGVYMNSTDITEFDCVSIGDYCAINSTTAALQTHLYEDRIMKVGRIELERGVTVGRGATVLYDTHIGQFAQLGPLTIVMKGEHIPANTRWHGAPAQCVAKEVPASPAEAAA